MPGSSAIIFDNNCKFCNSAVRFLHKKEGHAGMDFFPAKGHDAEQLLHHYNLPGELTAKTVILITKEKVYIKSTAILKALQMKGRGWRMAGIFLIVPVFIRDAIYDWVASIRR